MYIKLFGSILILAGCGGFGIMLAVNHRRETAALHQIICAVDGMLCELEFRMTPLPELCRVGGALASGAVRTFFICLAAKLDELVSPDVCFCTEIALRQVKCVPSGTASELRSLGQTLGRFDLQGQLNALRHCSQACRNRLEKLEHQQPQRLRSYQTLGFCAGAALAILLF